MIVDLSLLSIDRSLLHHFAQGMGRYNVLFILYYGLRYFFGAFSFDLKLDI
jgi:hypothetical protein